MATRFDQGCGNHGPREETTNYQKPGAITRRTTYAAGKTDRGVWMAKGMWRAERLDKELRALDAHAARKVRPMGAHGLIVRKGGSK